MGHRVGHGLPHVLSTPLICIQTFFFLNMSIVFFTTQNANKTFISRKIIGNINFILDVLYTKTGRNNRKKTSKWTITSKSPEIRKVTDAKLPVNVTLQALFYSRFVLFCFDSFAHFSAFLLVVWVVLLLFWKSGFVLLLWVLVKIINIIFITELKLGCSRLN